MAASISSTADQRSIDDPKNFFGLEGGANWGYFMDEVTGFKLKEKTRADTIAKGLRLLSMQRFEPGNCGEYELGPLDDGLMRSPIEFWYALISPYAQLVRVREDLLPYTLNTLNYGDVLHDFSFDRMSRSKLLDALTTATGYANAAMPLNDGAHDELDVEVGPIRGRMSFNDALRILIGDDDLMIRWVDRSTFSIEPRYAEKVYADMSKSVCSFGLPELGRVTVTRSRLPWGTLADITSLTVLDNSDIESSGKDNLPDLLQQLSQTAFHRGLGYRQTGTQCAALRGVGAVKVMINGKPTFGSAADFFEDECVDLNAIPLSAVERIEVSPDTVSLAHGADALGGSINIVLSESNTQSAEARYQGARGGAGVSHGSVVAGLSADSAWPASLVLDYSETSSLIGFARERWRDQDYRRFGSRDYRSTFAAPANFTAFSGNLPGLQSSTAAVRVSPTGSIEFVDGEQNKSSLFAWQAIVPEIRRMNVSAIAEHEIGNTLVRSEFMVADRSVAFQYAPEIIPGFALGELHPQNPFGIPVMVSAALTGLPLPEDDVNATLLRGVLQLDGRWSRIDYSVYALHSTESAERTSINLADYQDLFKGLSGLTAPALDVTAEQPGLGGEYILSPASKVRSLNGGTVMSAMARADVMQLPGGNFSIQLGGEARREFADYGNITDKIERDVVSVFGIFRLPVLNDVKATFGTRVDDYEQIDGVTSNQYALTWQPLHRLQLSASYNDTFGAPRMFDLFFPAQSLDTMIFDPSWQQLVLVNVVTGGNESLRPTVGRSSTLGFAYGTPEEAFHASLELWSVSVKDRISYVLPQTLLAFEDSALDGRIVRDPTTSDDVAASRRGRLRTLDLRRANFGGTDARGIDASIDTTFRTEFGRFSPRLDITYTDSFRYSDMPSVTDPGRQRTGVADVLGTITKWRLRGWLSYRHRGWDVNVLARFNSCYQDFDTTLGLTTGRDVCPKLIVDLNVAKEIGEHLKVSIGSSDTFDHSPRFSEVNGPAGYDSSQDDLVGRTVFLSISGQL